MKRRTITWMLTLLLLSALSIPALAWTEYGVIYDETEQLWSEELGRLGAEVLPTMIEKYDIDMRVDILTSISGYEDLAQAAATIYKEYGYGGRYGGNGVTLTLLVHEDETGIALDGWYPYAAGDSWELTTNGTWNICRNADTWLSMEAWSGDLEQDIEALTGAVTDMAEGLESFVQAGGVHSTIWSPVTQSLVAEEAMPEEAPEETPKAETKEPEEETPSEAPVQLNFITDAAALLSETEWETLEQQAGSIAGQYGFGVYIIAVEDYTLYAEGDVAEAAEAMYEGYALGASPERNGILLLLSTAERDYALVTGGDYGAYAFNTAGREALTDFFLDDFAEDSWYNGFSDYLKWCGTYLEEGKKGTPFSADHLPMEDGARTRAIAVRVAAIFLVPLVGVLITNSVLNSKMRSVAAETRASGYTKGNLILTAREDRYTHSTEKREKVKKESENRSRSSEDNKTSGKF